MTGEKILGDVLKRSANNFDLLRLMAALAVIVGHAYFLAPQPAFGDGVRSILHFDYSGSLAVKFFFFLSGLLVTNSIIAKPEPFIFMLKRICRIFPGLLGCLLIAVFVIGPLFTKLSLGAYFSNHETWTYLGNDFFLLHLQAYLPGVFADSPYSLNGSLWTLPFEMAFYIYLAIFYGLGILRNRVIANIFFSAVVVAALAAPSYLPAFFRQNAYSTSPLPAFFAFGALLANNKSIIPIGISKTVLLWVLAYLLRGEPTFQYFFYIAFFYTAIYVASLDFVVERLHMPFDASYGVYVYAFMVQQCVHALLPGMGVHGNQLVAAVISIGFGILSWYVIEKRCIEWGHKLAKAEDWKKWRWKKEVDKTN